MNKPNFTGVFALLALSCEGPIHHVETPVSMTVASLANSACGEAPSPGLPDKITSIVFQLADVENGWKTLRVINREDGFKTGEILVENVPAGSTQIQLVACADDVPQLVARSGPTTIKVDKKHYLNLHFRPLDALSCTGNAFVGGFNQYAALDHPRAFASATVLSDNRVLITGGGDAVNTLEITADLQAAGWDLFDENQGLFLPGVDREQPLIRPLNTPRLAGATVPYSLGETPGALLIGGAQGVIWGAHSIGPLKPTQAGLAEPYLSFFNQKTGSLAPVRLASEPLVPRFLPGVAVSPSGKIWIVGGAELIEDTWTPSARVETIDGNHVERFELPVPLLGPSVTPLNEETALVWGADIDGCGAQPGWLLRGNQADLLFLSELTPTCMSDFACRDWYATGYHSATRLPDVNGRARVLITGGIRSRNQQIINNPDPGLACKANAFILSIDLTSNLAEIQPLSVPDAVKPQLKRAFHQSTRTGDTVLITGGWRSEGTPTALLATEKIVRYTDSTQQLTLISTQLVEPILGQTSTLTAQGGILLTGGLASSKPVKAVVHAAIYVPPLPKEICAQ